MTPFPDVSGIAAVLKAWPRLFAKPPVGMQPLTLDGSTLVVLCQTPNLVSFVRARQEHLVGALSESLDGIAVITTIAPALATATEMHLARELLALKIWLWDFDDAS